MTIQESKKTMMNINLELLDLSGNDFRDDIDLIALTNVSRLDKIDLRNN